MSLLPEALPDEGALDELGFEPEDGLEDPEPPELAELCVESEDRLCDDASLDRDELTLDRDDEESMCEDSSTEPELLEELLDELLDSLTDENSLLEP